MLGDAASIAAAAILAATHNFRQCLRPLVNASFASSISRIRSSITFGYLEPALRVAAEFPQARFEHAGGYKSAPNLATYDARYYEARWLAGWLAGRASKSGVAGYVAGFPVPEVVQGINAFALGMRAANPSATVRVVWLNTWFDPAKERDAAQALIDQGADVLTHHSASPAVAQAAQASFRSRGVRVVSYPSDMRAFAPDAQLAAIVHRWGGFYTRVAERVIDGSWRPEPVWGGIASGMVDIDAVDAALAKDVRAGLQSRRAAIVAGTLAPFAAPLLDNAGTTRLARGALADADIKSMDWFVAGVVGSVPKAR
jgi:simple sugar transport system substrate-binding protein